MTPDIFAVIDATWPAASVRTAGGFRVREGKGGGSRVSCASLDAPVAEADIDAAIAAQQALGQPAKFIIRPGDGALDTALDARGFEVFDPVIIYEGSVADLPADPPPMSAFAHWPPLEITREVWTEGEIGPPRQAVMDRACTPKTAILGRIDDRAAGAAFVAAHQGVAMLHGLVTLPAFRRRGLGAAIMAATVRWAQAQDVTRLTLVVTAQNKAANALYQGIGMRELTRYHYRRPKG